MKVITVYQPFAFAILAGIKRFETRTRRTSIRGRVGIHAGLKGFDAAMKGYSEEYKAQIAAMQHESPFIDHALFRGGIIGTVQIVDCVPVEEISAALTNRESLLGDYSKGRFAWVLESPIIFSEPIRIQGKRGWWNWDETEDLGVKK